MSQDTPMPLLCPACKTLAPMSHDTWEDMYRCKKCDVFLYPEDVGVTTNKGAGVFNIGEKNEPSAIH